MSAAPYELDVRAISGKGEPFAAIMEAVNRLEPGQEFRLIAPFEPVPLFGVLAKKGYRHAAKEGAGGDWEVIFTPGGQADEGQGVSEPLTAESPGQSEWPEPSRQLDNRDLDPPEPMTRTLAAIEEMQAGEVLCSLLCREPVFLIPELRKRGHEWRGGFEPDGSTYKLLIRAGAAKRSA
jgi:uncharacterized protein (DUF2249 family)